MNQKTPVGSFRALAKAMPPLPIDEPPPLAARFPAAKRTRWIPYALGACALIGIVAVTRLRSR